jgi:hypothetical protein
MLPESLAAAPMRGVGVGPPVCATLLCIFDTWFGIGCAVCCAAVTFRLGFRLATRSRYTTIEMLRHFRSGQFVFFGVFGVLASSLPLLIITDTGDGIPSHIRWSSLRSR